MTEWKTYKLGELCSSVIDHRGKTPLKLGGNWVSSGYRALSAKNIKTGQIVQKETIRFVNDSLYKKWMKEEIERGCIIITSEAPFGEVYYWDSDEKIVLSQRLFGLKISKEYDSKFIYYYMRTHNFQEELRGRATGTTVIGLRQPELLKCHISLPPLEEQRRIAGILGAIDDKIENNRRINTNLELQAQALYKQWFVDNRCDDWEEKPLSEIINIYDSQRKPLSGQQREKMDKVFPYYGAASLMDYVDDYLFDGIYLLLGEDGTVVDELGFPILQYVWGKFWVNNHAHILTGKNGFSTETLYVLLKQTSVKSIVTGAVQPKISQANLKNILVTIPPKQQLSKYNEVIEPLFRTIRKNNDESSHLTTLRDTLLPKLMNGEIKL